MFREQVSHTVYRLADELRRAERVGVAIDEIARSVTEGVFDIIGRMMNVCDDSGGQVGKCGCACWNVMQEIMSQVVPQVIDPLERKMGRLENMFDVEGSD